MNLASPEEVRAELMRIFAQVGNDENRKHHRKERQETATFVLASLHEGNAAWRFPFNQQAEFKALFGRFFTGEPLTEAEVSYDALDAIIAATGAKITHHWRCPKPRCDRPPLDRILLPPRSRFINDRQYHASRIHEVVHFLEQPWRVGWIGSDHQGEMVAECATGFLEAHLRLPHDQDNTNINKWLPKWAEGIQADPNYLYRAVAVADSSVRYLLDLRRLKAAA
jgi:antirestriction protein ArdC